MTFIARGLTVAAAAVLTLTGAGTAGAVPAGSTNGKLLGPSALGAGWHVISAASAPPVEGVSGCGDTIYVISPASGVARAFKQHNRQAVSFVTEGIQISPSPRVAAGEVGGLGTFLASCKTVTQTVNGKLVKTDYHSFKAGVTGAVGYTVVTSSGSAHTASAVILTHKGNEVVVVGATVRPTKGADTGVAASVAVVRRDVKLALAKA